MSEIEVIDIDTLHGLPRDVQLELYEPPWMSEDEIAEVAQLFERKNGHPPNEIYLYKHQIFVR